MTSLIQAFTEEESYAYFVRNYDDVDLATLPPRTYLREFFELHPIMVGSALEIGCGPGSNLRFIRDELGAARVVGTEPSKQVTDELNRRHTGIEFEPADSRSLPFADEEFDLVVLSGVLPWIDRQYVLHVLGETLRVASRYVFLADFAPVEPHRVPYHHKDGLYTFKMSYRELLCATRLVRLVYSRLIDGDDDWTSIESGLYEKLSVDRAFPVRPPKA